MLWTGLLDSTRVGSFEISEATDFVRQQPFNYCVRGGNVRHRPPAVQRVRHDHESLPLSSLFPCLSRAVLLLSPERPLCLWFRQDAESPLRQPAGPLHHNRGLRLACRCR